MFLDLEKVHEYKGRVHALIHERHKADMITLLDGRALEAASFSIEEQRGNMQVAAILNYLGRNAPYVYLFRDAYTMRALRAGLEALERKERELWKEYRKTDSQ